MDSDAYIDFQYKFDNEEQFIKFAKFWSTRPDNFKGTTRAKWKGPGWYFIYTWSHSCSRRCCTTHSSEFVYIEDEINLVKDKIYKLATRLKQLKSGDLKQSKLYD